MTRHRIDLLVGEHAIGSMSWLRWPADGCRQNTEWILTPPQVLELYRERTTSTKLE